MSEDWLRELYNSIKQSGSLDYEYLLNALIERKPNVPIISKKTFSPQTFNFKSKPLNQTQSKKVFEAQYNVHGFNQDKDSKNDAIVKEMVSLLKNKEDIDLVRKMYQIITDEGTVDQEELLQFLIANRPSLKKRLQSFKSFYTPGPRVKKSKADQKKVDGNLQKIYSQTDQNEENIIDTFIGRVKSKL